MTLIDVAIRQNQLKAWKGKIWAAVFVGHYSTVAVEL